TRSGAPARRPWPRCARSRPCRSASCWRCAWRSRSSPPPSSPTSTPPAPTSRTPSSTRRTSWSSDREPPQARLPLPPAGPGADADVAAAQPVAGDVRRRARPRAGRVAVALHAAAGPRPARDPQAARRRRAHGDRAVRHLHLEPADDRDLRQPDAPADLRVRQRAAAAQEPLRAGGAGDDHHLDARHVLGGVRPAQRRAHRAHPRPALAGLLDPRDQVPLRAATAGDLRMSQQTLAYVLLAAQTMLGLALALCAYRLVRGPRAQDRVTALDALYMNGLLSSVLLGIRTGTELYFEAALVIALTGFVSTSAVAKFLMRGEVIE